MCSCGGCTYYSTVIEWCFQFDKSTINEIVHGCWERGQDKEKDDDHDDENDVYSYTV